MTPPNGAAGADTSSRWPEIVFLGGVLVVAVAVMVMTTGVPAGEEFMTGPRGFPMVVASLVGLACVVRITMAIRRPETAPDADVTAVDAERAAAAVGEPRAVTAWRRRITGPWGVLLISMGYALLLRPLGFILASWLYASILAVSLHPKGIRGTVPVLTITAAMVLVAWVTFVVWLRAPLPRGVLG